MQLARKVEVNEMTLTQMKVWVGVYNEEVARVVNVLKNWDFKRMCK